MTFWSWRYFQFIGGYGASYGMSPVFFYKNGDRISAYNSNIFNAQIDIGTSLFRDYLAGFSLGYKNIHSSYDSGERRKFDSENIDSYTWGSWYLLHDSMNSSFFPFKRNIQQCHWFQRNICWRER